MALFQRGYLDEAATSFKQVITAKPDDPIAYYNLGTLYLRRNALAEARPYLEQTVKLRPTTRGPGTIWGWSLRNMVTRTGHQGFPTDPLLRPTYVTTLLNLRNLLRLKGAFDEAQRPLECALEAAPDDPEANYSMGMLYACQNQLERALDYLEKAAELHPDSVDLLNNLGVLLVRQGQFAEAKEKFETCIRVAPKSDQAYLNLARLYVLLNEKGKAREVLQALLRQQPEHKLAQQALEVLN